MITTPKPILEGKICLITGSGDGIGRAIAEKFASEGAIVYANDILEGSIDNWLESVDPQTRANVIPLYFDLCDSVLLKQAILQIKQEHSVLDVVVNNAGVVSYEFLPMIRKEAVRKMFEVNVFALIETIQLSTKLMISKTKGSIINIASIVAVNGVAGQLAYSASKGAVVSITKSAAKELAKYQIRVNAVAPGMVATQRLSSIAQERFPDKVKSIGLGRMAEPEEIAEICCFLGSDASSYITGQIIGADGSMEM